MAKSRRRTRSESLKFEDGLEIVLQGVPTSVMKKAFATKDRVSPPIGKDGRPNPMDPIYAIERQMAAYQPAIRVDQLLMLNGIKQIIIPPAPKGEEDQWYAELDSAEFLSDAAAMDYLTDTPSQRRFAWAVLYLDDSELEQMTEKINELSGNLTEKK
jgi:hypothetical protein